MSREPATSPGLNKKLLVLKMHFSSLWLKIDCRTFLYQPDLNYVTNADLVGLVKHRKRKGFVKYDTALTYSFPELGANLAGGTMEEEVVTSGVSSANSGKHTYHTQTSLDLGRQVSSVQDQNVM